MNRQVLRQIQDIQVQADRIINDRPGLENIYEFGNYSKQIKEYLVAHVKDSMILDYVRQIPDLEERMDEPRVSTGILSVILFIIAGWFLWYFRERRRVELGQDIVRDIRGKYASIEFLLKNSIDETL